MPLLEVKNLSVEYPVYRGLFGGSHAVVRAVQDVDLAIEPGETVGLVGESGCGKSTLGRAITRIIEPTRGEVRFEGVNILELDRRELRARRRDFQMIFQDPVSSLNPRRTVGQAIGEALEIHQRGLDRAGRRRRIEQLLRQVGLDAGQADSYPHEFSGGQRQRVGIARALAVEPRLIVCDEPVSALDVSVQAQVVNLLQELQGQLGLAYLFIAHDLAVVEHISRRLLVMYLGRIIEAGRAADVIREPKHPYTRALVSAVPTVTKPTLDRIVPGGEPPSPLNPPPGCAFHTRCPWAQARCRAERPLLQTLPSGHAVACHFPLDPAEARQGERK